MPQTPDGLHTTSSVPSLMHKLKWLVGGRLLLASILLGSAGIPDLHQRLPFDITPLYGLLGLTFALSLIYAVALRSERYLAFQGRVQIGLDLGLVSLLVHYTGGIDSVLAFMYIFVILGASNLLERRGSLIVALLSSSLYGMLVIGEWTQAIRPVAFAAGPPSRSVGYAVYQVLIHTVAFLAVAILSSHLAYRLRQAGQELEQRGLDLRSLQTLHQVILANISSGLLTLDLDGRVVSFNQAAERITGYTLAALQDHHWRETPFAPCSSLPQFFADPDGRLEEPTTEIPFQRQDGRTIPLGIACSPLRAADGQTLGLAAIFQDLTERKRVEEQLRRSDRLAALGQLAANIAHEVRNPLAAISGAVEVLREDLAILGANRELLDILLNEAGRLKLITGQFLDFAKPQPLLFRPVPVRPLLDETLRLLERSHERHPDTILGVIEESPNLAVLADGDQLRQVVWNLCLNAIQSMPGGGSLTILLRPAAASASPPLQPALPGVGGGDPAAAVGPARGEWVELAFRDTGRGIPSQNLGQIFDPFFTTRPSGTGLGLAIAKKILESMGGQIRVESHPGGGTTFYVRLQRAPAGAPSALETGLPRR